MSKLNQIQQKLIEIDATKFHKLLDIYLNKKYDYAIHSVGTKIAEDKPAKGTPDSLVTLQNGNYIFIEYTTQKINIVKKFIEDISKCINLEKTGIEFQKIEKIILACNSKLSSIEIETLQKECQNITCEVITISTLSIDLLNNYSSIVKDFLHIEVDTGQILDSSDFILTYDASRYATTPLDTTFQFRKKESKRLLDSLVESHVVLVTGKAGIGKTKLAMECCQSFADENEYTLKCILNRGANIFDDIKSYFGSDERFVIFIDDVNRIKSAFNYINDYYPQKIKDGSIKLVLSVRDYAKDKIYESLGDLKFREIELYGLKDEEIQELVKKEYGILNPDYLDRISHLSDGNPRLALMISKIAKEENSLDSIQDISNVYDNYFSALFKEIELNQMSFQVIAIICFFRVVDKSNEIQTKLIEDIFAINPEQFWDESIKLHQHEICDMYENEVVKISDQVLSTYLFYYSVFKEKYLSIETIIGNLFLTYPERTNDVIIPVIDSFDGKKIKDMLVKPVKECWSNNVKQADNLVLIMKYFWYVNPTDTLLYCKNYIDSLEMEEFDMNQYDLLFKDEQSYDTDNLLDVLKRFRYSYENFPLALELLLDYFEKQPLKLKKKIVNLLTIEFGYFIDSHRYDYAFEKILLDLVWKKSDKGNNLLFSKLYLEISKYYFALEHSSSKSIKRNVVHYMHYPLIETSPLLELRKVMWEKLFGLFSSPSYQNKVLEVIINYTSDISYLHSDCTKILQLDALLLTTFFQQKFSSESYYHCKIIQEYINILESAKIEFDVTIKSTFTNKTYELSKTMLLEYSDYYVMKQNEEFSIEEIGELIKKEIESLLTNYETLLDFEQFINACVEIDNYVSNFYTIRHNFDSVFDILFENDKSLFVEFVKLYLKLDTPIPIFVERIVKNLIEVVGRDEAFSILNDTAYSNKQEWIFSFYTSLSFDLVEKSDIEKLKRLYEDSKYYLPKQIDYLKEYINYDKDIIIDVCKIILEKSKENNSFLYGLNSFIYVKDEWFLIHFKSDILLLQNIYLKLENFQKNSHFDYSCNLMNFILDNDSSFIEKYIEHLYQQKNEEKGFLSKFDIHKKVLVLWERDDYVAIFSKIVDTVYKHQQMHNFSGSFLSAFFSKNYAKNSIEINKKQKDFIYNLIKEYALNKEKIEFLFKLIIEFDDQTTKECLALFLSLNNNFENFKLLELEPSSYSSEGSFVVYYSGRKKYYESLLNLCEGMQFIEHKQHIEKIIESYEKRINYEKKRDFIYD